MGVAHDYSGWRYDLPNSDSQHTIKCTCIRHNQITQVEYHLLAKMQFKIFSNSYHIMIHM